MRYDHIREGRFLSRPNRFIAHVEVDGKVEVCHVKNTGRCRELLIPGTTVWIDESDNPNRKTRFDLIAVDRGGMMVNMDSQAPNRLFAEWAKEGHLGVLDEIKAECRFGESRFDFRLRQGEQLTYVEVKGCTLEVEGEALFPDAPTERGVRHIRELMAAKVAGHRAILFIVIQMKGAKVFRPNRATHPAFADALQEAQAAGVEIMAWDCVVSPETVRIDQPIEVRI
ncbi:MAG: DNA/RNA nuclease SfsA [Clostridia bacterium]|nr:DNA/RNA nuclease SfsA [Clostridia bacterium]